MNVMNLMKSYELTGFQKACAILTVALAIPIAGFSIAMGSTAPVTERLQESLCYAQPSCTPTSIPPVPGNSDSEGERR